MLQGLFGSSGQRALEGRLAQAIAGRETLTQEIANIDTPGYSAADAASFQATMATAVAAQLGGQEPGAPQGAVPVVPLSASGAAAPGTAVLTPAVPGGGGAVTPDGNGMDFDALMVNLAKNDLDFQSVTRQLQLTYTNLSDAIDLGR